MKEADAKTPESESKGNSDAKIPESELKGNSDAKTPESESKTPSELDWMFDLIDSIKQGTFNPIKWPEFFKIPTPPQIVLIEMLELAKQYLELKVKAKVIEYQQKLTESKR